MKISYDDSVDAAYIKLKTEDDRPPFGFTYCCDPAAVDGQIDLDFDLDGRLIGISAVRQQKASFGLAQKSVRTTPEISKAAGDR